MGATTKGRNPIRRLAVITALIGATTLIAAAPAPAQTLTPSSAEFPPTKLRTASAPIRFTLTNGTGYRESDVAVIFHNTTEGTSFKQTNTCPYILLPMESCFIDVVFAPDLPTPVHKSNQLYAGGLTAQLSGDVKSSGGSSGGKKKGCKKKGKKRSAAAAKKKCKKK